MILIAAFIFWISVLAVASAVLAFLIKASVGIVWGRPYDRPFREFFGVIFVVSLTVGTFEAR